MRWGRKHQSTRDQPQDQETQSKNKNKTFSFSPLSWLSKLTSRHHSPTSKSAASPPPCLPKHAALPSPLQHAPAAAAQEAAPRRLSVGNADADANAARRHHRRRLLLRHYSLGGDADLPALGHPVPFSRAASPPPPPSPSDASGAGPRHRRRRPRGGRRSFSGRMPARVRVRSPRRAAATSDLEKFAVVRRTRDPQKVFRESMVEMIASRGIGRPEELERLLACYLALNADEHHDCIVKVFRQVWFEINPGRAGARLRAS